MSKSGGGIECNSSRGVHSRECPGRVLTALMRDTDVRHPLSMPRSRESPQTVCIVIVIATVDGNEG